MIDYKSHFKPVLDRMMALLLFIVLSPIGLLVAIALSISLKGNPLFVQIRPGKNEELFKLYKFKTMLDLKDDKGNLLQDMERLTTIGKVVRSWSLDELPQLINVLKGDMSFIGPRPLLVKYLPLYNSSQRIRHQVKPGITGWAQVNGRNAISWEEKFELDVWYVRNECFKLDIEIILLSVIQVFRRKDINVSHSNTMSPLLEVNDKIKPIKTNEEYSYLWSWGIWS